MMTMTLRSALLTTTLLAVSAGVSLAQQAKENPSCPKDQGTRYSLAGRYTLDRDRSRPILALVCTNSQGAVQGVFFTDKRHGVSAAMSGGGLGHEESGEYYEWPWLSAKELMDEGYALMSDGLVWLENGKVTPRKFSFEEVSTYEILDAIESFHKTKKALAQKAKADRIKAQAIRMKRFSKGLVGQLLKDMDPKAYEAWVAGVVK